MMLVAKDDVGWCGVQWAAEGHLVRGRGEEVELPEGEQQSSNLQQAGSGQVGPTQHWVLRGLSVVMQHHQGLLTGPRQACGWRE